MARLGMDVDAVEQAARDLKSRAGDLGALIARIESQVGRLPAVWQGKDADAFVHDWWPRHKKDMSALQGSIEGLGQSAWNNAQEQRRVSDDSSGTGPRSGTGPSGAQESGPAPTAPGEVSSSDSGGISTDSTFGAGILGAARQVPDGSHGGQCAIFAEDMIVKAGGPRIYLGSDLAGYQDAWAKHATQVTWQSAQPGDIIQWYDPNGKWGSVHTAILAGGNSEQSATVVDSNHANPGEKFNQELVHQGSFSSRNSSFHPGTYMIWRVNS